MVVAEQVEQAELEAMGTLLRRTFRNHWLGPGLGGVLARPEAVLLEAAAAVGRTIPMEAAEVDRRARLVSSPTGRQRSARLTIRTSCSCSARWSQFP